jgi:cytochrome c biogenesis protein CcdA
MIEDYLVIIVLYCLVATLPLIIITLLLAGGHKLSRIQRWRESNKTFLQYTAGIGIIIAGLFVWVNFILLGNAL